MNQTPAAKPAQPGQSNRKVGIPPAQAIQVAARLFSQNRFAQAVEVSRQILERKPELADAYNILGVSLNAMGQGKQAIDALRIAVKYAPGNSTFYANLGEIQRQNGELDHARKNLERAVEFDPNNAQAQNNLGIVKFESKDYEGAVDAYEIALKLNPKFAEAHNNLGNGLRAVGRGSEAMVAYQKALEHREVYPEAYNNLGTALREEGKDEQAEHAFNKAISQNGRYLEAFNNLAMLYLQQDRTLDALRLLGDALKIDDKHIPTLLSVTRVQIRRANTQTAEMAAKQILALDPTNTEALVLLGQIYHDTDRYDDAVEQLEKAVALNPEAPEAYNFYGIALKSLGRLDDARAAIRKAIELQPKMFGAYANLNDLVDYSQEDELFNSMMALMDEAEEPDHRRYMSLHFALGKALEDRKAYPEALAHYLRGAKTKRAELSYDPVESKTFFTDIAATFSKETFANRIWTGNPSDRPVFIVGMPRSGSTLVEQILSSHPGTYGAGEVKYLSRALSMSRDRFPGLPKYPQIMSAFQPFQLEAVADNYLKMLEVGAESAPRVTDKLLTNFYFVGLIHLLFPNAKIIHTQRNPIDTCLSGFTKLFKDDMAHSYDFAELGGYYRNYQALMQHWDDVLPAGVMKTVQYEEVTADVEGNARALIDFIGLEWDDACVDFHKSSRPVKTASVVQVRKPVYQTSVERWRRYGDGLKPLVEALGMDMDEANTPRPTKAKAKAKA
jgi:tetratricopeptide (TPR) repeat protein